MGMKEDAIGLQPGIESGIPFQLPERKSRVNTDIKANHVAVVISGVFGGWITNAVNILGEFFAGGDVAVHCDASKGRVEVNWKDGVLAVDIREVLERSREGMF